MKKLNPGYIALILITLATVVSVSVQVLFFQEPQAQAQNKELELFYMYGNTTGSYFLEPQAEYENLIYVSQSDLNDWDITPTEPGQKFTGTFDPTGWDLITLKHKEEK